MKVIKRDGREVDFDKTKIEQAIKKAYNELGYSYYGLVPETISATVEELFSTYERISVEDIQDEVENCLLYYNNEVGKTYIKYRYLHAIARDRYSDLMKAVGKKLRGENIANQNANVDERSFGGRQGEATRVLTKDYALNYIISEMAAENHKNNRIYIHDLDNYAVGNHNCLTIPFDDLFKNGFNTRQTDVRPPKSVSTAFQLLAVIFQIQSLQQFGGVSSSHLDWTMVPYVRMSFKKHYKDALKYIVKDKQKALCIDDNLPIDSPQYDIPEAYEYAMNMTEREIRQAVEGMYHNLNTLQSRSGNQLPFTSINYGTCTLPEGRMVTKHILGVLMEGTGKLHRTSIFPCGIFQCMKGVNRKEGDPNYDLYRMALRCTARRLYPNYANVDWSGNEGYDVNDPRTYFATMGCRTANGWDINGFGQLKDGRGNICPVTIILPTLAMEAKEKYEDKDSFYPYGQDVFDVFLDILDDAIKDARDMLIERFEYICSQPPEAASFMYENNIMAGYIPEEGIRSALKHGTLAIGQLGLAECLQILVGCDHTEKKGMILANRIEELFQKRCKEFKEEYKLNFGVYYTPAENLCYTAMQKFKEKYGVIPNVSDREFFTNSMHVPVWKDMNIFDKIDIESQLTGYSSAGCITYVEMGDCHLYNVDAFESVVNYAMDHDIPYFAINVPNDQCMDCGYTDELDEKCPNCGSTNIRRLRRVTGYLTGDYKTAFNPGKIDEVEHRVKHKLES